MADCTTLDPLLVGWLYDELEPAEAARFRRHIDDCAACRHTAHSLTRLRALMRELPEEPPPEAALVRILQQAAEHAAGARRRPWAWLVGWLETAWAHPAAAALATMVLIAGVAGALFTRGQLETAEPELARSELAQPRTAHAPATGAPAPADKDTAAPASPRTSAAPAAPASIVGQSSETIAAGPGEAEAQAGRASGSRGKARSVGAAMVAEERPRPEPSQRRAPARPSIPAAGLMELVLADQSDPLNEQQNDAKVGAPGERANAEKNASAARAARVATAAAEPPRAGAGPQDPRGRAADDADGAASTAGAGTAAPVAPPRAELDGDLDRTKPSEAARRRDERTWAESMHDALRTALRQQECARATLIADDIRAREPAYYRAHIAAGKELAACRQAADAQRRAGEKNATDAD